MVFTESKFLAFLFVAFWLYWALPKQTSRKQWLLLCSYVFYASWDYRFAGLLLLSSWIDYFVAFRIHDARSKNGKRCWLGISLATNLGILGFFKYFDFFSASFAALVGLSGIAHDPILLNIVLPVGISFYTFQALSYTVDVYRGERVLYRNFLDFALYLAFFPQLVAGPIVRAHMFLQQIQKFHRMEHIDFRGAGLYLVSGYFKKAVIADNLAVYLDPLWAAPLEFDAFSAWMGFFGYSVQIYCDFSGYSDIALGLGKLFGIDFPVNFRYPLLARSITEFWRRWHITLSQWFQDYVYRPLGGSTGNQWTTDRNLLITMTLVGLWHGASLKFLAFGLFSGLLLCLERVCYRNLRAFNLWQKPGMLTAVALSILAVIYGQIAIAATAGLFRAPSIPHYLDALRLCLGVTDSGPRSIDWRFLLFVSGFWAVHLGTRLNWKWLFQKWNDVPSIPFAAAYGMIWAFLFSLAIRASQPFVYFAF